MPVQRQTELSKGSSFLIASGLGGALDTERLPAVKTETEPKYEVRTGDTTVGRPRVKTQLSMPGDQGREQRCPPGFEGVTPIPYGYAAEVDDGISGTQRQHDMTREILQGPEPPCSRKDFLDEAVLIGYDGTNMPYIMFYYQIMNLLNRCYYSDRKLALLRAACVRTAAQTIAVVISDTPGFKDDIKINMILNRLAQRFGVSGGFLNEPEVRKIGNAPKISNTSIDAWRAFKDELTQCFVFAHSYKQPGQLEGRFAVDLARRLPTYAKQEFLGYLNDRFGCTSDPTFDSLMGFVVREEKCKVSDFCFQLMTEEKLGRSAKSGVSVQVKRASAHVDSSVSNIITSSVPPKGPKHFPVSKASIGTLLVAPQCFVCKWIATSIVTMASCSVEHSGVCHHLNVES